MKLLSLATTATTAAALSLGCKSDPPPKPAPVTVLVAPVVRRAMPVELSATGTVEPIRTVAVQTQVNGQLQRVAFREGEDVQAGQVLFEIDPRPYRAALAQAEAELSRAKVQAASAEQDEARYKALVDKQYVTTQQYDQAHAALAGAKATVAAGEAAVEEAQLNLQYTTIRAPIGGRTGSLLVREGNLVRANSGTSLVTINQMRPIRVRFTVPATHLPEIQRQHGRALTVRAEPPGGGTPEIGHLTFVDNAVDTLTGTVMLKGEFANTSGTLWPGAFVNTNLELYVQQDALIVPAAAVVSGQQGSYIYLIQRDGTARTVAVTIDRPVGNEVVVKGSLSPGDQVVTDGQLRLRPGVKVQIRTATTAAQREV
jgi:multidrug efflux system membrane fusion protein